MCSSSFRRTELPGLLLPADPDRGRSLPGYHYGLPVAIALGYKYEPELSNIENMIRGVRFEKLSRSSVELPTPQLTKGNFIEGNVNLNFKNLPLLHCYTSYD